MSLQKKNKSTNIKIMKKINKKKYSKTKKKTNKIKTNNNKFLPIIKEINSPISRHRLTEFGFFFKCNCIPSTRDSL